MKQVLLILTLVFAITQANAQSSDCKHGQCSQIKSDGEQCKRCVGYLEYYCSSHKTTTYSTPIYNTPSTPTNPSYNTYSQPDCKYSQCSAIKQDGTRCRRCTGGLYESYCSTHKL